MVAVPGFVPCGVQVPVPVPAIVTEPPGKDGKQIADGSFPASGLAEVVTASDAVK